MAVKRKYHKRKSKFDVYSEEIEKRLECGFTYEQIAEAMQEHFEEDISEASIAYFIRARGLKSKVTQGCRNGRIDIPKCDECDSCKLVANTAGTGTIRVRTEMWKAVSRSCLSSPMWCGKRDIEKWCEEA